jgi:hydroxymethylpyrimidine/phosphomethylpyrimidine kinase
MLASREVVEAVAAQLRALRAVPIVVDPVLRASSGAELLEGDGLEALEEQLLPLATVVTPNLAEAGALSGHRVGDVAGMKEAAKRIAGLGARNVVVTGGHLEGDAVDVLYDGATVTELRGARLSTGATHGTGCAFSTAIAACLAGGQSVAESTATAKEVVAAALRGGLRLGKGAGPVHPLAWLQG